MTTYTNPVLDADWPDPDVVRVGDDYYLVASSFNRAPGLPVLHSRDLVTWEHVTNALPALPPLDHFSLPRHGGGVWAPSLRHHDGTFYLTYPDPDHGIYVLTASDPRGPWSAPHLLLAGRGIIDPCPLWDDDGRTYLVHGWAKSRSGAKNRLTLVEVDAGLRSVVGPSSTVVDGDAIPGCSTLEGPKMHRRDGWYWIFAPGGGVATGWQYAFRSRDVRGPYEHRTVLEQGPSDVNGPHQGAWVEATDGTDWFVHFQDRGPYGRVVHLQPMVWQPDGWPRIGATTDDEAHAGNPARTHAMPGSAGPAGGGDQADRPDQVPLTPSATRGATGPVVDRAASEPSRDDDFRATTLAPRWHWQANPSEHWARLDGDGVVRLSIEPVDRGSLREVPAVLGQQLPGTPHTATTSLLLAVGLPGGPGVSSTPDHRAGLVVLGTAYAWIGIEVTDGVTHLVCRESVDPDEAGDAGPAERDLHAPVLLDHHLETDAPVALGLRSSTAADGEVTFSWRLGPGPWQEVEQTFTAREGRWIGAELGLFACGPVGPPALDASGSSARATFGPFSVNLAL
ncbi:glycoside hydrolase family 43 protein [Sanguibacter sp. Leaf3]|uniref:glycoside hydrolase family 43 protein n=1 Tax=Sanguibacter sp. Leaf3 TaxID=1736209 RepID=UPI0006F94255|nr:glycoside hydrolase 43 family protein [Sanguibacter sp. Leaf3]KQT96669.1 hypothetical protein ASG53_16520 [Sanguibacter sp. Leaf3]